MNNTVENQYDSWVYPKPIKDMRQAIANGSYSEIGDPYLYQSRFWPRRKNIENLDILVAGCGSVQAAYYACRNPNWNVTGIDISQKCLDHQNELRIRHDLYNLTLYKCDLFDLVSLNRNFDFIVSTGVIHHLPDPVLALSTLRNTLRPDGVINLMVYGQSLRLGVYIMQEAFRLLGCEQTQEDVELVKETIRDLHPEHVLRRYINNAPDLYYDAAIVDTFLPSRDKAYFVKEIYELTRNSGLEFLTWCDPLEYSYEASIPSNHPLRKKLEGLKSETAEHVCDLVTQLRGTHRWAAAHPEYVRNSTVSFETDEIFNCIISLHGSVKIVQNANHQEKKNMLCVRRNVPFEISYQFSTLIERANGVNTLNHVLSEIALSPVESEIVKKLVRSELKALWKQGHLNIQISDT